MTALRDTYGNTGSTGYTINWFSHCTSIACDAYLASPFFTTAKPIDALTQRGCTVHLLVRLCSVTNPGVLRKMLQDPLVRVRYYTDRSFHAKLYIVGNVALIGSANLTDAGLMTNREVSVVLHKGRDSGFDDLTSLYEIFWSSAETLTPDILAQYEVAFRLIGSPTEEAEFQRKLETLVPAARVPSAKVGSEKVSKDRAFLQKYHRKYDEQLIPAFREVEAIFADFGRRRPEFEGEDPLIEIGRFLGWCRLVKAPGEAWRETSLAGPPERRQRVRTHLEAWLTSTDTKAGDMYDADKETGRIHRLREAMAPENLNDLSYDDLFEALIGVHAFNDRLRHVSGGTSGLKAQFFENTPERIKAGLSYLLHGPGVALHRAYDCIHNERWKLAGFGEACVMELLGWLDPHRPPINGRTVKALRFFGFDVRD